MPPSFLQSLRSLSLLLRYVLPPLLPLLCLLLFLLLPSFVTSTFFLIMIMVLLDVLAGFIVTIVASRKDFDFGGA